MAVLFIWSLIVCVYVGRFCRLWMFFFCSVFCCRSVFDVYDIWDLVFLLWKSSWLCAGDGIPRYLVCYHAYWLFSLSLSYYFFRILVIIYFSSVHFLGMYGGFLYENNSSCWVDTVVHIYAAFDDCLCDVVVFVFCLLLLCVWLLWCALCLLYSLSFVLLWLMELLV